MSQKVTQGGSVSQAPLGYRNTRRISNRREARIVTPYPERADLVAWAFAAYASLEHTLRSLVAKLAARGLTTLPPPACLSGPSPSRPCTPSCPTPSTPARSATAARSIPAAIHRWPTSRPSKTSKPSWPAGSTASAPSAPPLPHHRPLRHLPLPPDHHRRQA